MNPGLKGKWFRSEPVQYTLGNTFPVKLDFLAPARQFTVPEVCTIALVFTGTMDTTSGAVTFLGRDFAKLFDKVLFQDEAEVINASGATLRVLRQFELGAKAIDPTDNVNVVTVGYEGRLEIHLEPLDSRAARPRDFRIPLEHFLEGGSFLWSSAAALPTNCGPLNANWSVRTEMLVKDGRVRELKSRRRIWDQVINQQEFDYAANGSLRAAIITSKLTTTGYTSLAAFTTIYSRTLELPPTFAVTGLREDYRKGSDVIGANDEVFLGTTLLPLPGAIPLAFPIRAQKIGHMIDAKTLHIDLQQAAPAGGRLLLDCVVDRTPNLAALTMGYQSPGELSNAIRQYGEVIGAESNNYPAKTFYQPLLKRLPVRLQPGKH